MKNVGENNSPEQVSREQEKNPEWHCDTYCRKIRHVSCEGEKYIKEDAPDLCPYFEEMLY
ncbi:MAG: hypothetical protein MR936_01425 [Eubacterium sp.]|nr:hypothetical protein [Eubacterium sp.]